MIRLFTDTSANLSAQTVRALGLTVIPFSYSVGGEEAPITDPDAFDGKAFYDAMRSGATVKTAMIGIGVFLDAFRTVLEAGDDVLYIAMSGGISGTCQAAMLAAEELRAEFPARQLAVFDTLAASLGEGLLVLKAAELLRQDRSLDEILSALSDARDRLCQYFTVDDLEYLKRGGRISRVAGVVGTVLKIKPLLTGNAEGKIVLCGKCRGRRQSLSALAEHYEKKVADKTADIAIADADDAAGAEQLLRELRQRGFTGQCVTACYEPVTGAHVGPGTVALFFFGTEK